MLILLAVIVFVILPPILVELSLRKLSPLIEFYKNKPKVVDVMRRWDIPKWSRPKLYLGSLLIFPRLTLVFICVVAHYTLSKISILGFPDLNTIPLPWYRRNLLYLSSRFWARLLLFAAGFWKIDCIGEPQDCSTIVSTHCSWVDFMYFLTAPELPCIISKAAVKSVPFVGVIATAMQCIFIERTKDRLAAIKEIENRYRNMKVQKGFPKLMIFPEGTTTNGTGLMPFKKGGFLDMQPVQPVCMVYAQRDFSPCMEILPALAHTVLLYSQFVNRLEVHRLPVCTPKNAKTPEEYAEEVRDVVANYLGIQKVNFSIEDKIELIKEIFSEKPKEF